MKIEPKDPSSILPSPLPGRGGRGRDLHGKLFADNAAVQWFLVEQVSGFPVFSDSIHSATVCCTSSPAMQCY